MTDRPAFEPLNDLAISLWSHADEAERKTGDALAILATGLMHWREVREGRCGKDFHIPTMQQALEALEKLVGMHAPPFTWPRPDSVLAVPPDAPHPGHASCNGGVR